MLEYYNIPIPPLEVPKTGTGTRYYLERPNFSFRVPLPAGANEVEFRFRYLGRGGWIYDINDADGAPIVRGSAVVVDRDILRQFVGARRPPGGFFFIRDKGAEAPVTRSDLGTTVKLYYVVDVADSDV